MIWFDAPDGSTSLSTAIIVASVLLSVAHRFALIRPVIGVFASLVGYLVCQQFSGYSLSWFLYALCAFASCIDRYGGRRKLFLAKPGGSYLAPLRAA